MKYIILFLFATLAHAADLQVRQITSEQTGNGYMYRWVEGGEIKCWAMGDVVDLTFIPPTWTPVTQAAIDYRWPVMTGDAAIACLSGVRVPRTFGGALFTVGHDLMVSRVMTVPNGIPCGDKMSLMPLYRSVTYEEQTGFALCL